MSRLMELSRRVSPSHILNYTLPFSSHLLPSKPSQNPSSSSSLENRAQIRPLSTSNHSTYMNQLFPRSNSSFKLTSGNALQSDVVRLSDEVFLVDSGIGTPRTCLQDELIGINRNKNKVRFENLVGFLDLVTRESRINQQLLERIFIDLIAGDATAKERATARFNDMIGGSADVDAVAAGEPLLVLPRRYRQKRAWMELNKARQTNSQVKGFVVGKVRGGYAVAIGGFVAFVHYKNFMRQRGLQNDRFTIESISAKTRNIVVR